jgi:predicted Zn finger-like uncharacterized protein
MEKIITCKKCRKTFKISGSPSRADELLNRLRCANCRQVTNERFYDVTFAVMLIASMQFLNWLLFHRSTEP